MKPFYQPKVIASGLFAGLLSSLSPAQPVREAQSLKRTTGMAGSANTPPPGRR
jgi:hypothetical protein